MKNTIRFLVVLITISSLGDISYCQQIEEWERKLSPQNRNLLKSIKFLWIDRSNVDVIWDLESNPDRADVVGLAEADLTKEMQEILRKWVFRGKGIIVYQDNVRFICNIVTYEIRTGKLVKRPLGRSEEEFKIDGITIRNGHKVVLNLDQVNLAGRSDYIYSFGYKYIGFKRSENIIPILEAKEKPGSVIAFVAKYGEGRILCQSFTVGFGKNDWQRIMPLFNPSTVSQRTLKDNPRFYFNCLLWLSGQSIPR